MIEVIAAKKNLGCLALKIGELFYIDTFKDKGWSNRRGFFMNISRIGRFWFRPWSLSLRYEGWFFLQIRPLQKQFKKILYRNWR